MSETADFAVNNHGTIWTFHPLTEGAIEHAEEMFPDDCMTLGHAYVVEHRYAPPIVKDLLVRGYLVTVDGDPVELRS